MITHTVDTIQCYIPYNANENEQSMYVWIMGKNAATFCNIEYFENLDVTRMMKVASTCVGQNKNRKTTHPSFRFTVYYTCI